MWSYIDINMYDIYNIYMWDIYMDGWTLFICLNLRNISYFNKKCTWCFFSPPNIKHIKKFLLTSPHLMEDWVQHLLLWNCKSKLRKSTMLQWWQVMLDFDLSRSFQQEVWGRGGGSANWATMLRLHWLWHSGLPTVAWRASASILLGIYPRQANSQAVCVNSPSF